MCPPCWTRYRTYGTTKRTKWKTEHEPFDREMAGLRWRRMRGGGGWGWAWVFMFSSFRFSFLFLSFFFTFLPLCLSVSFFPCRLPFILPPDAEKPGARGMRNVRRTRWTDAWAPKQTHTHTTLTHTSLLYVHRVSSSRPLGILLNTQMLCLNKSSTELIEFVKFLF